MYHKSLTKISFLNSYKMKISIIFGVAHMLFGIFLSLLNHMWVYYCSLRSFWNIMYHTTSPLCNQEEILSILEGEKLLLLPVIITVFLCRFFNQHINIYCEFIPQVLFMCCLFLYLVFLIFYKWVFYGAGGNPSASPACAPSILTIFIDMVSWFFTSILPSSMMVVFVELLVVVGVLKEICLVMNVEYPISHLTSPSCLFFPTGLVEAI